MTLKISSVLLNRLSTLSMLMLAVSAVIVTYSSYIIADKNKAFISPKPLIDQAAISVSGVSSGAYMAHQLHVTYSDIFMGAGLVAGGPYYCAEDMKPSEITIIKLRCMTGLPLTDTNYVQAAIDATTTGFQNGTVADPANLKDDKVFIFNAYTASGLVPIPDQVINPLLGAGAYLQPGILTTGATNRYYSNYDTDTFADTYLTDYGINVGPFYPVAHGMPTKNPIFDKFTNSYDGLLPHTPCAPINSQKPTWFDIPNEFSYGNDPWIYHCDDLQTGEDGYDLVYDIFHHIYPQSTLTDRHLAKYDADNMYEFEQLGFVDDPEINSIEELEAHGINETGYIYVPENCQSGDTKCKLHVALHGCQQFTEWTFKGKTNSEVAGKTITFGRLFVDNIYNDFAEMFNAIILYPQAHNIGTADSDINPYGCWEFWAFFDEDANTYYNNQGRQMKMIRAMIDSLEKQNFPFKPAVPVQSIPN